MANDMQLQGFKEMAEKLKQLGPKVAKKYLRRAVSTGTARVRDTARMFAPEDTGDLKKDIQIKRRRDVSGNDLIASYDLYVRSGKKSRLAGKARNVHKDSFYWKFFEFGTSKMAKRDFLRPAFEAEKEDAVKDIGVVLDEGIQETARELAGRT